jgi:hypothetical protein
MKSTTSANNPATRVVWHLFTESGAFFSWFNSYSMANACLDILGAGTIVRKVVEGNQDGF